MFANPSLVPLCFVLFLVVPSILPAAEDPLTVARNKLYTNRGESIAILEEVVRTSPNRIDAWIQLIHALNVDSQQFVADCTNRAALKLHPNKGELWQARAALFQSRGAVYECVQQMEKVPGYEQQASDARELLTLGQQIPFTWDELYLHNRWAVELIVRGRWKRAEEIVARGLALFPKNHPQSQILFADQALILAQAGEFEAALEAQRCARFPQFANHQPPFAIADLLLTKGEHARALESFGAIQRPEGLHEYTRLLLSQTWLLNDQREQAGGLLEKGPFPEATLLLIADHLRREDRTEAHELGKKLIMSWPAPAEQQDFGGFANIGARRTPQPQVANVAKPLARALAWLTEEFPDHKQKIETHAGRPTDYPSPEVPPVLALLSFFEEKNALERKLAAATEGRDRWFQHKENAQFLASAGRYEEAAAASVENALAEMPPEYRRGLRMKPAAEAWSIYKRRAEAIQYFDKHPEQIAAARSTIYLVHAIRYKHDQVFGKALPSEAEVIAKLTELGPGIMALVHDALQPNTISGQDRTVFVRYVENCGDKKDVPLLVDLLGLIVQSSAQRHETDEFQADNNRRDALSVVALHQALEKLTSTKNSETDPEERVKFWHRWWSQNARSVLLEQE